MSTIQGNLSNRRVLETELKKIVTIIQARMGSTRFPGKMMADLHGQPLVEWVIRRCKDATRVDEVVLSTSRFARDDPLAAVALECDVQLSRGPEEDVLTRFALAATLASADIVVRVCGDRPLVDPGWTDMAIEYYQSDHSIDLAYNHIESETQAWPRGFGVEVFSADLLRKMEWSL